MPALTEIAYSETDLLLSLRYYLLHEPVRAVGGVGAPLSIPALYPTMAADTKQGGIRIGDLFVEEKIPTYPILGVSNGGMVSMKPSHGWRLYRYSFFIDGACQVLDSYGRMDHAQTEVQRSQLMGDLRLLLTDGNCLNIPYATFDLAAGTRTPIAGSTFSISRSPSPRIMESPVKAETLYALSADFQIEVCLTDRKR